MTDRRTGHVQLGVASRIEVMLGCRFVTSVWKNAFAVIVVVVVVMRAWQHKHWLVYLLLTHTRTHTCTHTASC